MSLRILFPPLLLLMTPIASAQLTTGKPESVGLSSGALERSAALLENEIREGRVHSASILVARHSTVVLHRGFGRLSSEPDAPAVEPDSIYQVASITKPVTAIALMQLVERGQISLTDPVQLHLPEFTGDERAKVRVVDLLSHTSGMPDMLPENTELRRAHAPLEEFVRRALRTPLLFTPGTDFSYQSMGILLAAEIVRRIAGMPLAEFEDREIFEPLGMKHSVLGLGRLRIQDTVQIQVAEKANPEDVARFGSNTEYWRKMGHPWGGMHTTTSELATLLQTFLRGGIFAGKRIVSPATVTAMTTNQNGHLDKPWGIGFGFARSAVWSRFGDLVSPETFGHSGASGTVAWADPKSRLICVILTGRPARWDDGALLRRVSNTVAAAVDK
jgi:CubicO group peptidase (beta-lactamase class C family)